MRCNQAWAWVKFFIHISNLLSFMLRTAQCQSIGHRQRHTRDAGEDRPVPLSIGDYPSISLPQARERREQFH